MEIYVTLLIYFLNSSKNSHTLAQGTLAFQS
jgi:hypothetical protein